jgi:hypothetical protein
VAPETANYAYSPIDGKSMTVAWFCPIRPSYHRLLIDHSRTTRLRH